ncbi:MAG: TIGR04282 family arsenosugar biosynthesis glycosyltransferase [Chloroflexi bacterium]|nr:TIGR04282 family arsenosugar biosynthesis glycosyltransferase [Chloroflexota bacterium]
MTDAALVIMAREPVPGRVKTRLQPHLAPEECASLYLSFLGDVLDLAAGMIGFRCFVACDPPSAERFFQRLIYAGMTLISQPEGGDLGDRMSGLIKDVATAGFSPVVLVGSDLPLLRPAAVERSLEVLAGHDLCFGPATDGGYYLVGANGPVGSIFEDVAWGTSSVLSETLRRACDSGLTYGLLEEQSDVDTYEDLVRLVEDLRQLSTIPGARLPRHTVAWLDKAKGVHLPPGEDE